MSISRPSIIGAVFRLKPEEGEFTIENLALRAWRSISKTVTIADEEFISKFRRALYNELQEKDLAHRALGGIQAFDYLSPRELRVRWAIRSPEDKYRRLKLTGRASAMRWIDGFDSDRDYEYLGALLMKKLGAQRIHVTPKGNEFGIDFLALVPAYSRSSLFISGSLGLRVVGQSKFYSSAVAREKIQSFNDVMSSIRNNKAELFDIVPAWFRNNPAPVLGLFVAHAGYQSGAKVCAGQNGYVLFDSSGVSEVLACSANFDLIEKGDDFQKMLWLELQGIKSTA